MINMKTIINQIIGNNYNLLQSLFEGILIDYNNISLGSPVIGFF